MHYLLRIDLLQTHPPIWREFEVPAHINLAQLHHVIQTVMGWENEHLHCFTFKGRRFEDLDLNDGFGDAEEEAEVSLDQLLTRTGQKLAYLYDFGDNWEHSIKLKKIIPGTGDDRIFCRRGDGACPLEDSGGVWGHAEITEQLVANPEKRHELIPEDFDPHYFDLDETNEHLELLQIVIQRSGGFGVPDLDDDLLLDGELQEPAAPKHYETLDRLSRQSYASAIEEACRLREAEPWNELWDQDIFCILDPDSGLLDILSILGRGGEVYALHVHRPPEGYHLWKSTMLGELSGDPDDYLQLLHILEVEFVNKSSLEDPELALYDLDEVARPPRGRRRYVRFKKYRPRCYPWFLPHDDLPLLRRGMRLAHRFIELLKEAPDRSAFKFPKPHLNENQLPEHLPGFRLRPDCPPEDPENWEFGLVPIDWSLADQPGAIHQPGEFELERVASFPQSRESWELGAVYTDYVMSAADVPVKPIVAVVAPLDPDKMAPFPYLEADLEVTPSQVVWKCFYDCVSKTGKRPIEIHVKTDVSESTLRPLEKQGIRIKRVSRFENLDDLFRDFLAFAQR